MILEIHLILFQSIEKLYTMKFVKIIKYIYLKVEIVDYNLHNTVNTLNN